MSSRMLEEARSCADVVERQNQALDPRLETLSEQLRRLDPQVALTVARGSSDHAASYFAYVAMQQLGLPVASLPMSVVTLQQAPLRVRGQVALGFSQSGQSPDLVAPTQFFREHGAITAAFVNDPDSPLALASQWVFPLHAGAEKSVAATKSFIAQMVAGARVVAAWQQDASLQAALDRLPDALTLAAEQDWSAALPVLKDADKLLVIGRGTGLAVAMEAALKLKETCAMQAEAFSGAEVQHGPMALVDAGYPLLIFAPRGPAQAGLLQLAKDMTGRGANVLLAAPAGTPGMTLPLVATAADDLDPIAAIQSFYPMVEALARARGFDPDRPRHLAKVTRTH